MSNQVKPYKVNKRINYFINLEIRNANAPNVRTVLPIEEKSSFVLRGSTTSISSLLGNSAAIKSACVINVAISVFR